MDSFRAKDGARLAYRDEGPGLPLLALAGLVILAGPAVVSLLAKDKNRYSKFGLHQGGSAANPRDHR